MEQFQKQPFVVTLNATSTRQRIKNELLLLRSRWHIILLGLAFQYVHGIFTQLAYRMHQPTGQPLHDVGFELIPELPADARWVSEAIFTALLLSFIAWSFTPLLAQRSFSTAVLWTRLLTVLVVCQSLRILSFSSTQLPGPAPHCHAGTLTATRPPVTAWWQHLVVDVRRQVATSCGDLIFSSHMTFILTGVLAYTHYGSKRLVKAAAWAAAAVLALLIIAARKHYTVDVVIAWYVVPMVYTLLHVFWRQRCSSSSSYDALPTTADDSMAMPPGKATAGCFVTVTGVPASGKQELELPSSWGAADSSCRCSADGTAPGTGSSSYCSSYNISPRSGGGYAGAAGAGCSSSTGRTVSPRRARNVWLFGHAPWRQQQQFAATAAGTAADVEAGSAGL